MTILSKFARCDIFFAHPSTLSLLPITPNLKEPNMTKSRLALLIDSLASGSEVFSSHAGERGETNEMEVLLSSNHDD